MMWKVFQLLIFVGFLFANVYWQWTPNGYLASLIAVSLAFATTWAITQAVDLLRRRKRRLFSAHQGGNYRRNPWVR